MALEGTIKDFGLPDIFQLIGLQRKTGLLTLKNEKETVTVTFENGMVVMADSSQKRLEDRLGSVLVKQGKLTREKLDEALATQKATLQRMGHILTTGNFITEQDLKDALQVQISQIVFKVFRWRDGEYHFAPTDSVDYDRENFNPMSADFILMEGIRMVDEWPIIEKKIPSMDIVLRPVVDPSMIEVGEAEGGGIDDVLTKRGAASSLSKIRLGADEERIYRKVDGTRTVQAIIDASGMGEFEVCRILFDLLNRNIISTAGRGDTPEAFASARSEGPPSRLPGLVAMGVALALSLLSGAARWGTPFAVVGLPSLLSGSYALLLDAVSEARLGRLDRAVEAYGLATGGLPRTLEDLVKAGLVDRSYLKDPWERPYHYAQTEAGYLLSGLDAGGHKVPATTLERSLPPGRP
jgi:predicted transcriptional regulator